MKLSKLLITSLMVLSVLPFAAYLYQSTSLISNKQPSKLSIKAQELSKPNNLETVVQGNKIETSTEQNNNKTITKQNAVTLIYPELHNQEAPIGINTNEVYEQDASVPFIDLFRVAAPFHEHIRCRKQDQPCLTSPQVTYDKQGWPKNLKGGKAGTFFIRNVNRKAFPPGQYTVLYDGEGKIEYLHNAVLDKRKPQADIIHLTQRSDNFMTAALQIVASNPDNPLRNIRILMPGGICSNDPLHHANETTDCGTGRYLPYKEYYQTIIFNPDYLDFMKDFGLIRFMPMSGITRNPAKTWDERPKLDQASWGGNYGSRGVPLEIMVELANRLNIDPWLNVPHAADDNYMYQFAIYVHDHLKPGLTPHIEYTNEAWNVNFIHNEYMQKMGIQQQLDKDALMAGYKYYAKRAVEFFDIWEMVYGGHDQFVRIISGWDTRPDISGIILAYQETYKKTDALAIAPYVGGNIRGFRAATSVDDIFTLLNDEKAYRSLPKVLEEVKKHAKLARNFGVSLISYEGGQGLVDWATRDYKQHPNPLFFAANRDPRMGELYLKLYAGWRDAGGDLFTAFSAPRSCNAHGCWGLKEYIRQPLDEAPKLKATLEFIRENKKWWDWKKIKNTPKPDPKSIANHVPTNDPDKPRIVIRPARGNKDHFLRLENPQATNILLEGKTWDKRDISGKWQVKWDEDNIYLVVRVYDDQYAVDSDDPTQDDSVEFFIDANNDGGNNQGNKKDNQIDYHLIFKRVSLNRSNKFDGTERTQSDLPVIIGKESPDNTDLALTYRIIDKYDGYEIHAILPLKKLGLSLAVRKKLRMDVVINDDDDGGTRDARIAWNTRKSTPAPKDLGMVLVSGR